VRQRLNSDTPARVPVHTFGTHEPTGARAQSSAQAAGLSLEDGNHAVAASALEALATVEAVHDPERGARMLGAAHAVLEDVGDSVDEEAIMRVRAAAGDEAYERVHAEGRTLSLDAALALALGLD